MTAVGHRLGCHCYWTCRSVRSLTACSRSVTSVHRMATSKSSYLLFAQKPSIRILYAMENCHRQSLLVNWLHLRFLVKRPTSQIIKWLPKRKEDQTRWWQESNLPRENMNSFVTVVGRSIVSSQLSCRKQISRALRTQRCNSVVSLKPVNLDLQKRRNCVINWRSDVDAA